MKTTVKELLGLPIKVIKKAFNDHVALLSFIWMDLFLDFLLELIEVGCFRKK